MYNNKPGDDNGFQEFASIVLAGCFIYLCFVAGVGAGSSAQIDYQAQFKIQEIK